MNTPTPETDAAKWTAARYSTNDYVQVVDESVAAKLEQERDEARAQLQYAATKLASVWLPKDQEEADAVKAERDQLREIIAAAIPWMVKGEESGAWKHTCLPKAGSRVLQKMRDAIKGNYSR